MLICRIGCVLISDTCWILVWRRISSIRASYVKSQLLNCVSSRIWLGNFPCLFPPIPLNHRFCIFSAPTSLEHLQCFAAAPSFTWRWWTGFVWFLADSSNVFFSMFYYSIIDHMAFCEHQWWVTPFALWLLVKKPMGTVDSEMLPPFPKKKQRAIKEKSLVVSSFYFQL